MTILRIRGKLIDISKFADNHPGGKNVLITNLQKLDATNTYDTIKHSKFADSLLDKYTIGIQNVKEKENIKSLRKHIIDDTIMEPYRLVGLRIYFWLLIYYIFTIFLFVSNVILLYINPLYQIYSLLLSYFYNNLGFMWGHIDIHLMCIEYPEAEMGILCHNSFIHHYRDINVYKDYWLETRLSYFVDVSWKGKGHFIHIILFLLFAFSINYQRGGWVYGLSYFVSMNIWLWLQSVVHEYYHVKKKERKMFYSRLNYKMLTFFESIGILNTEEHYVLHHDTDINTLDKVSSWNDMKMPNLFDTIADLIFQKMLKYYKPGEKTMTKIYRKMMYGIGFFQVILFYFLYNIF